MSRYKSPRVALIMALCFFVGCRHQSSDQLRIGVTPGPAEEILETLRPALASAGVNLKVITFTDYVQPDLALAGHDLDANLYQNTPFLNQFDHDHGTSFAVIAKVYVPLMAIYAGKAKSLDTLPDGARISLPNDPVNQARALQLLQSAGLIVLKPGAGNHASIADLLSSPHQVQLVELDASQLPRSRDDVDIAVINANFALDAGLNPLKDSLAHETLDSEYANILAADSSHASNINLQKLGTALRSDAARAFITAHYKGAILPAS